MELRSSKSEAFAPRAIYSHLYPLDEFYAARNCPLPAIGRVDADEVPEPYRQLLVHQSDMTSTLENFHGDKILIHPLATRRVENEYYREVLLCLAGSGRVVEYGAIKIVIDLFPDEAQREILKEQRPLGQILNQFGLRFSSSPSAFLRIEADDFIRQALRLSERHFLFGRRNTLMDQWGRPLAEIVEILPPTEIKTGLSRSGLDSPDQNVIQS